MTVIVQKTIKVRLYSSKHQQELLAKTFGCKRFVWNYWLKERETYFEEHDTTTGFKYTTAKELKQERPWLKEPDSIALQQARIDIDTAYKNCLRAMPASPDLNSGDRVRPAPLDAISTTGKAVVDEGRIHAF